MAGLEMPPRDDDSPIPDSVTERELQHVVQRYRDRELTLAEAAHEVGVERFTMRMYLADRDVELRLGPTDVNEIQDGADAIRRANR